MTPVCETCGAVFPDAESPPDGCPICEDERQWVPTEGQLWTSLEQLAAEHANSLREEEQGLLGIGLDPEFAIGQRLLLVETSEGNVIWDMIPLCTEVAVAEA